MGMDHVNGVVAVKPRQFTGETLVQKPAGGCQAQQARNLRISHPSGGSELAGMLPRMVQGADSNYSRPHSQARQKVERFLDEAAVDLALLRRKERRKSQDVQRWQGR